VCLKRLLQQRGRLIVLRLHGAARRVELQQLLGQDLQLAVELSRRRLQIARRTRRGRGLVMTTPAATCPVASARSSSVFRATCSSVPSTMSPSKIACPSTTAYWTALW
jgi:hypothetical protein